MGFTLILRFHGSIALVPSQDKKKVTMLIGEFDPHPTLKPLVPHIKFPDGGLQASARQVFKPPPQGSSGDPNLRHIKLEGGELLTLNAKAVGQPLTLNENDDPSPTPVRSTMFSLKWLPHIATLEDKEIGTIEPAMMRLPPQDSPPSGIAGRIDLTRGLLQTTGILDPVLIDFEAPPRPRITTAIAREAELQLEVDDDRVVIESDPLATGRQPNRSTAKDMTFLASGTKPLVITIGNEPEDEIHQPIPTIRPDAENDAEVVEEFRMLYSMSAKRNVLDVTKLRVPRVSGRRPSGNLCLIPRFDPGT